VIIWVRNIIFIVFVLSVIYAVLSTTGRFKQRKRLLSEYKASQLSGNKEVFIAKGLAQYDRSMRPKLFLFVFFIPIIIIITLIYLAQYT